MSHAIALPSFADVPDPVRKAKLAAAADTLVEVLGSRPRFRGIRIHALMKGMPGRVVAEATWRRQRCFLKLLIGWHAEAAIRGMLAELRFAEQNSDPGGRYRVASVMDALPRMGLIVLEAAAGVRVDDAVESADSRRRDDLHRHCGNWLAWYCAPRRETRAFDAERFLRGHRILARPPACLPGLAKADRQRTAALADHIERRANALNGVRISIAASHGDFLPRNAHVSGDVVTAYDIEGLRRLAVAADTARFLVCQQMRQGFPSDELTCGITSADWRALLDSGVLDEAERQEVLPLFVAQRMMIELPTLATRPNWQRRLRRSIDAFLRAPRAMSHWIAHLALLIVPVI